MGYLQLLVTHTQLLNENQIQTRLVYNRVVLTVHSLNVHSYPKGPIGDSAVEVSSSVGSVVLDVVPGLVDLELTSCVVDVVEVSVVLGEVAGEALDTLVGEDEVEAAVDGLDGTAAEDVGLLGVVAEVVVTSRLILIKDLQAVKWLRIRLRRNKKAITARSILTFLSVSRKVMNLLNRNYYLVPYVSFIVDMEIQFHL